MSGECITQRLSFTPEERVALAKKYPNLIPPPKNEPVHITLDGTPHKATAKPGIPRRK